MTRSAIAIGLNAVSNVSRADISVETLMSVLRTGEGPGGLVRALFGDCSLETLERLCAEAGMNSSDLRKSYRTAQSIHAAANSELNDELDGRAPT